MSTKITVHAPNFLLSEENQLFITKTKASVKIAKIPIPGEEYNRDYIEIENNAQCLELAKKLLELMRTHISDTPLRNMPCTIGDHKFEYAIDYLSDNIDVIKHILETLFPFGRYPKEVLDLISEVFHQLENHIVSMPACKGETDRVYSCSMFHAWHIAQGMYYPNEDYDRTTD